MKKGYKNNTQNIPLKQKFLLECINRELIENNKLLNQIIDINEQIELNTENIENILDDINSYTIAIYGAIDNLEGLTEETNDILTNQLGVLINSIDNLQNNSVTSSDFSELLTEIRNIKTILGDTEIILNDISNDTTNLEPIKDLLENIDLALNEIKDFLLQGFILDHDLLEGSSKDYTEFKSLTFTVVSGTIDIVIDGESITFPIDDMIVGNTYSADNKINSTLRVDATNGKALVTLIK